MSKDIFYLKIAGISSGLFAIIILLEYFFKITIPFSKLLIPSAIVSFFLMFFVLKGLLIMANKNKLKFLKIFIFIFLIFIIVLYSFELIYSVYYLLIQTHNDFLNSSILFLSQLHNIMYILFGIFIFKLRKQFKFLTVIASISFILTGILFTKIGDIIFEVVYSSSISFSLGRVLSILLLIIHLIAYICLSILFFKSIQEVEDKYGRVE